MTWITPLLYAVIMVESAGNPAATNGPAKGLMQMTPIGVKEALIQCPELKEQAKSLLEGHSNISLGACLLGYYGREADRLGVDSLVGSLILFNGGYRALDRYKKGKRLNNETANYVLKVMRILHEKDFNLLSVDCTKRGCIFKKY